MSFVEFITSVPRLQTAITLLNERPAADMTSLQPGVIRMPCCYHCVRAAAVGGVFDWSPVIAAQDDLQIKIAARTYVLCNIFRDIHIYLYVYI